MKLTTTKHARVERYDRIAFIIDNIGIGNEIAVAEDKLHTEDSERVLTDTGVIIVRNSKTHKLITAYIATPEQAVSVYKTAHNVKLLPNNLFRRIKENQKIAEKFKG